MALNASYSHAAPFIRQQIAYKAYAMNPKVLTTQKARAHNLGQMTGLLVALEILLNSPEGKDSPNGVAERDALPLGWGASLHEHLGDGRWTNLGFDEDEEARVKVTYKEEK